MKQESFDSENDAINKDDNFQHPDQLMDLKRINEKALRKIQNRATREEFLELDEESTHPSDSECSMDSKKVETDSLCLEDDDYPPSMIQDFKYDYNSNRPEENFSDLHSVSQKEEVIAFRPGIMDSLSRSRTSTKKDDNTSLEVNCSTETSLTGSCQDLSDDTTISDSESILNLKSSLTSKVFISKLFSYIFLVYMNNGNRAFQQGSYGLEKTGKTVVQGSQEKS